MMRFVIRLYWCFLDLIIFIFLLWFSFVPEYGQEIYQGYILGGIGVIFVLSLFSRGFRIGLKFTNIFWLLYISALLLSFKFAYNKKLALGYIYIPIFSFLFFGPQRIVPLDNYKYKICHMLSSFAFSVFVFGLQEFLFKKNILYQYIPNPYLRFMGRRMMSFHYHPSVLATYFLCVLPFSFYLIRMPRNRVDISLGFLGVVGCLLGILLSFTRTVFLIVFVFFAIYFVSVKRKYMWRVIFVFLILTIIFVLLSQRMEFFI